MFQKNRKKYPPGVAPKGLIYSDCFFEVQKCGGALTYQMESEGYAFLLGLSYALLDNLHVFGKATIYGALGTKSSLYKSWDDNDVVMVGLQAWF